MEKVKQRAVLYTMGSALFMAVALLLARDGMWVPAVFGAVLGILSAAECFWLGQEYELEAIWEAMDDMDFKKEEEQRENVACSKCNCERFQVIGGRLVCMCCGHVAEVDRGET